MSSGKGWLWLAIEDFLENTKLGDILRGGTLKFFEDIESETSDLTDEVVKEIMSNTDIPSNIKNMYSVLLGGKNSGGLASLAGFGAQVGMGAASGALAPVFRILNYGMDSKILSGRPDPQVAIAMNRRGVLSHAVMSKGLNELGWHDNYIRDWEEITRPVLPENLLMTLYRRGDMPLGDFIDELFKRGWTTARINKYIDATVLVPNIQDLITMSVKGAFAPDEISTFGLSKEFPEQFGVEAEKLGMDIEWAEKYWISHWNLPSMQDGFRMLHRLRPEITNNPFTPNDMDVLLKAKDISPNFREWMKKISYSPYTRVDVRRMYKAGILSYNQVVSAHKDIGYDDEKATNLADYVATEETDTEKDITKSVILRAYKIKKIDTQETLTGLVSIGYTSEKAQWFISLVDFELAIERQEIAIKGVQSQYVDGLLDDVGVYSELSEYTISNDEVTELIRLWNIARHKKIKYPTRTEIDRFYRDDIIGENEYKFILQKKRYSEDVLDWYMVSIDEKKADDARKEQARLEKEQQRLRNDELGTNYYIAKTAIDVQIAQLKVTLAEIKLFLNDETENEVIETFKERVLQIKVIIKELTLEKAELRHDLEKEA